MLTPDESRALAVLAVLVAAGAGLTVLEARHPDVLAFTLGDSLALGFSAPAPGDSPTAQSPPADAPASDSGATSPDRDRTAPPDTAAQTAFAADGRLDLNRASADELESLPGIGPKTAERIVADRLKRGRFRTVKDLGRVKGIGPKTLARLAPHLTVEAAGKR
jgi:competence protein ComEA